MDIFRSALEYVREAGMRIRAGNQDGALVLMINGIQVDDQGTFHLVEQGTKQ